MSEGAIYIFCVATDQFEIITECTHATVSRIDQDFVLSVREQEYRKPIVVETYASNWLLGFCENPSGCFGIPTDSGPRWIDEPCFLFVPPFEILELHTKPGRKLRWAAIMSTVPLRGVVPNAELQKRFLTGRTFRVPFNIPKNRTEVFELIRVVQERGQILYTSRQPNGIAKKFKSKMDLNFRKGLTLIEIAKEMKVSRVLLGRYFKSGYGLTPVSYRHSLRLFEALSMINRGVRITDAIVEVGYSDPSQFITQFHKMFESIPRDFDIGRNLGRNRPPSKDSIDPCKFG